MCDANAIWHNGIWRCDSFNLRYREDLEPEKKNGLHRSRFTVYIKTVDLADNAHASSGSVYPCMRLFVSSQILNKCHRHHRELEEIEKMGEAQPQSQGAGQVCLGLQVRSCCSQSHEGIMLKCLVGRTYIWSTL